MIGSLGGAIVDSNGARNYPGSGGLVGGLSFPGGNWAYFGGAGAMYNRFTPSVSNTHIPLEEPTTGAQPPIVEPGTGTGGTGGTGTPNYPGSGNPAPTNTGSGTIIPPGSTSYVNEPSTYIPVEPIPTSTIMDIINGLLAPGGRTNVASLPPLYSFNPFTNESGSVDMQKILIIGALLIAVYFAYTKFIR